MPKSPSQIARSLRALRNADRLGLVRGVRILLGPNACEAVLKQFASEYPANAVPSLPLPQCTSDRCQCKYVPVGSESFVVSAQPKSRPQIRCIECWRALHFLG